MNDNMIWPVSSRSADQTGHSQDKENGTGTRVRYPIVEEQDILKGGTETWKVCKEMGFGSLEAMQIRTAFSELARNILKYATEGEVILKKIENGLVLRFIDQGPGIEDVDQAMNYGYSTGGSLGLGLPGSKKLADKMEVISEAGKGTQVVFTKFIRRGGPRLTEAIIRPKKRAPEKKPAPPSRLSGALQKKPSLGASLRKPLERRESKTRISGTVSETSKPTRVNPFLWRKKRESD